MTPKAPGPDDVAQRTQAAAFQLLLDSGPRGVGGTDYNRASSAVSVVEAAVGRLDAAGRIRLSAKGQVLGSAADKAVGTRVMPWRIEDAAKERRANYVEGGLLRGFAVRDGRLITGQQQYSGRKVAEMVIAAPGT